MQLSGNWIKGDGTKGSGVLWVWGEWEPESKPIREFNPSRDDSRCPRNLWDPYYDTKVSYKDLHNTIRSSSASNSFTRTAASLAQTRSA